MPFVATWVDLEIIRLNRVSQSEKDKYHTILSSFVPSKKMIQMNLFTEQKQPHRHRKQIYPYKRGNGEWAEVGINIYTLRK